MGVSTRIGKRIKLPRAPMSLAQQYASTRTKKSPIDRSVFEPRVRIGDRFDNVPVSAKCLQCGERRDDHTFVLRENDFDSPIVAIRCNRTGKVEGDAPPWMIDPRYDDDPVKPGIVRAFGAGFAFANQLLNDLGVYVLNEPPATLARKPRVYSDDF